MTSIEALEEAIAIFGSASACAEAAGVSPQVLNNAKQRKSVSPKLADALDAATTKAGKRVTRERLVWGDTPKPAKRAA
jgi:DNA-binding transcriptional regulator YdaS (Cro superfamily)